MLRLILSRVALGLATLLAVSLLIFVATEVLPGDVASAVLGQGATPETLAVFRHELGLDRPAYVRYLEWLFNALRGDFGVALTNKRDIVTSISPKFDNTMFLAGYAALIAVPLAVDSGSSPPSMKGNGSIASSTSCRWRPSPSPNSSSPMC